MKRISLFVALSFIVLTSCKKDDVNTTIFKETRVPFPTHNLTAYSIINNSKYLVVFETGLGNDHSVWNLKNIPSLISSLSDVLLYDRAGYGMSEKESSPRNIDKLRAELENVINTSINGRKVILVGHSLGGMIIRDYAIKNPSKTAAILFIDPSHEFYNQPTQADEDMLYNSFYSAYGSSFGGTMEARELIEDSQYMNTISDMPDVPVIVLTSMKEDASQNAADRQKWFDAHELLKNGVSDFTHITTTNSGHYIMVEEPEIVLTNLILL
ncbi:MAG: alpha/beta fold hydrolase [Bacteroidales bacterium]|nr:MAG: alpha/beta fold hydrolase [Bacteroidales bacterium]